MVQTETRTVFVDPITMSGVPPHWAPAIRYMADGTAVLFSAGAGGGSEEASPPSDGE